MYALERYPRMSFALFGIGLAHLKAGRFEEAKTAYQAGLALTYLRSDIRDARDDLEVFRQTGDAPKEVEALTKLILGWKRNRRKGS